MMPLLLNVFPLLILLLLLSPSYQTQTHYLTASAVVSTASDPNARIECWRFETPFKQYPTVGMAVSMQNSSTGLTYVVLPPRSAEGLHRPPVEGGMFFVLLSGLARVTLPAGSDNLWIVEGVNSLIVAADTFGIGHYTEYPSDKETVALQLPFAGGEIPAHTVLKSGPCHSSTQVGVGGHLAWLQENES